ncbi:class I SAM-dependent methyltransferase [candidate division KSB1 bacterium]
MSEIQVESSHYFKGYDTPLRWLSYKIQGQTALKYVSGRVLEIGIGNKTVSNYLKSFGLKLITCDYDISLKPDIVCDICNLPFKRNSFNTVLCFEILEHLSYKKIQNVLEKLKTLTVGHLIISVPHFFGFYGEFQFKIPGISRKTLKLHLPYPYAKITAAGHCWELGRRGSPANRFRRTIGSAGLQIHEEKILSSESFHRVMIGFSIFIELHHYFVIKKKE